jgi:aspartyl-tRNA(Asn)/glutamyl-tRNA(Gln) amidotransferase subunit A
VDAAWLSATELLESYRSRSLSPVEVVDSLGARIEAVDPAVGAYVSLRLDEARAEAERAEAAYTRGDAAPLAGVPIAIKDLFDTADLPTAYGSSHFAGHRPTVDAAAVRRVREAGAIMLGKTQLHQFAWGVTSVNPTGSSRNPWAADRVPGGSSGGSGAALAAGLAPLALGTDTGGSIRIPAAFCGAFGLKPTYGLVPTEGVWPLGPSLDHVGPMTRTPADAALLLEALTGAPVARPGSVAGLRAAVLPELTPLEPGVRTGLDDATATLGDLGLSLVGVDLPELARASTTFLGIQLPEALLVHRRAGLYPDRRDEYDPGLVARLELAETVEPDRYVDATLEREELRGAFARLFTTVDVAVGPVSACPAPSAEIDPLALRELVMPYTVPANLAGLPACVVRAGFDEQGLPVAVQLIGPPGGEGVVLSVAQAFFDATAPLQRRWPELAASPA